LCSCCGCQNNTAGEDQDDEEEDDDVEEDNDEEEDDGMARLMTKIRTLAMTDNDDGL
jgi:hypothetical protein